MVTLGTPKSGKSPLKTPKTPKRKSLNESAKVVSSAKKVFATPSSPKKKKILLNPWNEDFDVEVINKTPKSAKKAKENIEGETLILKTPKSVKKSIDVSSVVKSKRKSSISHLEFASSELNNIELTKTPKVVEKTPKLKCSKENADTIPKSSKKIKKINLIDDDDSQLKPIKTPKKVKQVNENNLRFSEYESKFNIKYSDVKQAIEGIIKFVEENPKLQNKLLFNEQFPLLMQVACFKIPKGYQKIFRIPIPHSILTPDDDICLIVPDIKGIKNNEHEQHQQQYEDLLKKKGVSGIKKIMTFHEFRTEYETFELKNRLVDIYDLFLVDGRISGKVVQKGGKIFYKKRKVPTPVKLQVSNLKKHIEDNIRKAYFYVSLKSDNYSLQFGHNKMKVDDLVENVYNVVEFLSKQFPGGFENIRNLHLFAPRASSIPIYISMASPDNLQIPVLKNKKPKEFRTVRGTLTTTPGAKVSVKPSGELKVKRFKEEIKEIKENVVEEKTDSLEEVKRAKKRKSNESTDEPEAKKMSKVKKNAKVVKKIKAKKNK